MSKLLFILSVILTGPAVTTFVRINTNSQLHFEAEIVFNLKYRWTLWCVESANVAVHYDFVRGTRLVLLEVVFKDMNTTLIMYVFYTMNRDWEEVLCSRFSFNQLVKLIRLLQGCEAQVYRLLQSGYGWSCQHVWYW